MGVYIASEDRVYNSQWCIQSLSMWTPKFSCSVFCISLAYYHNISSCIVSSFEILSNCHPTLWHEIIDQKCVHIYYYHISPSVHRKWLVYKLSMCIVISADTYYLDKFRCKNSWRKLSTVVYLKQSSCIFISIWFKLWNHIIRTIISILTPHATKRNNNKRDLRTNQNIFK